jgi:hypothetical protein
MTIQNISNRHATPIADVRANSTGTLKSPMLSFEEHLSRQASIRPLVGASLPGRQIAATAESQSNSATEQNIRPLPFYVSNPNYNPTDSNRPVMIQDASATASPQPVLWTASNGLTTIGVMNPFGLSKNKPSMGYYGAEPTLRR